MHALFSVCVLLGEHVQFMCAYLGMSTCSVKRPRSVLLRVHVLLQVHVQFMCTYFGYEHMFCFTYLFCLECMVCSTSHSVINACSVYVCIFWL